MSSYRVNLNISYNPSHCGWNSCCMPPRRHHGCRPMFPMRPCVNPALYQMNMMNMYTLGYMTGNTMMSLMGFGQNNNMVYQPQPVYSYQQPIYPYQQPAYSYVSPYASAAAPVVPSYQPAAFGAITAPSTGIERTSEKVRKIDWSKVNPFKKLSEKRKVKKETQATERKALVSSENNLPRLNQVGYNNEKGIALAQDAAVHAKKRSRKYCAKYVKEAIQRCGLGEYEQGHAYECADILSNNNNFKEIKVAENEFRNLPAGSIIVYPKGDAGYSKKYGHIEIAMGNGQGVSDFINKDMKYSQNARVFIPVSA